MALPRVAILTVGPILMVGASYWLTMSSPKHRLEAAAEFAQPLPPTLPTEARKFQATLDDACHKTEAELAQRLDSRCRTLVRPPYVLGGDLTSAALDEQYRETILPTARALSVCYFDHLPDQPITILMFSSDRLYREFAERLDGHQRASYFGYYQRDERRIVLNIATGNGTLAHELTHALAQFDFPELPEWLDEGLATLHEECRFSADDLELRGISNWRLNYLLQALQQKRLRSIHSLMTLPVFRADQEAVDYAQARYFCLFLQQRGLLVHYYRKFRTLAKIDTTGYYQLCELLQVDSPEELDRQFHAWLITLPRQ